MDRNENQEKIKSWIKTLYELDEFINEPESKKHDRNII